MIKPLEFLLKGKHCEREEQKQLLKDTSSSNVSVLKMTLVTALLKLRSLFTIGEKLILPAAKDIYHELLERLQFKR